MGPRTIHILVTI